MLKGNEELRRAVTKLIFEDRFDMAIKDCVHFRKSFGGLSNYY